MSANPHWQAGLDTPKLTANDIHIWRIFLNVQPEIIATARTLLAVEEQERAARFYFHQDRRCYIVARGALRDILGRYLGQPPKTIRFQVTEYGKPHLAQSEFDFNVSHSAELALIAIARQRPVGVDVEYAQRPLHDADALVDRYFSVHERNAYRAVPAAQKQTAFYNGWTRKEAYIKARGEGLSHPLDQFDVELRPGKTAAFININNDPAETDHWSLYAFTPAPDYIAAFATPGPVHSCHFFDFS